MLFSKSRLVFEEQQPPRIDIYLQIVCKSTDGWQIKAKKWVEKHIDNASIDRIPGASEWFDVYENDVNHMLWSSQSPDLNPVEHLRENLNRHVRQRSLPPSSKKQIRECLFEEWRSSLQ